MKMSKILTLVFMTFLSLVSVNAEATNYNGEEAFTFDYHRLRVGGLILAAVLCLIGITILLSGHCRCKFNQNKRRRTGSNTQQMLNDQVMLSALARDASDLAVQQVAGRRASVRWRRGAGSGLELLEVTTLVLQQL